MKKLIVFALITMLGLGLFACGGGSASSDVSDQSAGETQGQQASESSAGEVAQGDSSNAELPSPESYIDEIQQSGQYTSVTFLGEYMRGVFTMYIYECVSEQSVTDYSYVIFSPDADEGLVSYGNSDNPLKTQ